MLIPSIAVALSLLGGHPRLEAFDLSLGFVTLEKAVSVLSNSTGRQLFVQPAIASRRALIELRKCSADEAMKIIADINDLAWVRKGARTTLSMKAVPAPATVWELPEAITTALPAQWKRFAQQDDPSLLSRSEQLLENNGFVSNTRDSSAAYHRVRGHTARLSSNLYELLAKEAPQGKSRNGAEISQELRARMELRSFLQAVGERKIIDFSRGFDRPYLTDPKSITIYYQGGGLTIGSVSPKSGYSGFGTAYQFR